jgi:hypothetical protein
MKEEKRKRNAQESLFYFYFHFVARPQQRTRDGGTSADAEDFACGEHEPGHPQQGSVCCQVTDYRPIYLN